MQKTKPYSSLRFAPRLTILALRRFSINKRDGGKVGDDEEGRNRDEKENDAAPGVYDPLKHSAPTLINDEDVSGGIVPRHGFRLRITRHDCGFDCPRCPWLENCVGCYVPDDNRPCVVRDGEFLTADFHITEMKTNFDMSKVNEEVVHESIAKDDELSNSTITMDACLKSFSKKEEVDEGFCSKCKAFHKVTKVMELWRLPPIMVVHLKRFQHTITSRRKLRNLVKFSMEEQDFSSIVAKVAEKDKGMGGEEKIMDVEGRMVEDGKEGEGEDKVEEEGKEVKDVKEGGEGKEEDKNTEEGKDSSWEDVKMKDVKEDEVKEDENVDNLTAADGRTTSAYSLYGIVHHSGAMSAGHYASSVREGDGWKIYNDDKVQDVKDKNVLVDPTAYLLFYVRKDVQKASIEDFWSIGDEAGEPVDIEKLLKERERNCSVM